MKSQVFAAVLSLALILGGCNASGKSGTRNAPGNQTTDQTVQSSPSVTVPGTSGSITREQAQAIALEHAGLTADQVTRLRTEYELDDGVPRYDVQFRQDRWEYDYDIHAETGQILSYDKDRID